MHLRNLYLTYYLLKNLVYRYRSKKIKIPSILFINKVHSRYINSDCPLLLPVPACVHLRIPTWCILEHLRISCQLDKTLYRKLYLNAPSLIISRHVFYIFSIIIWLLTFVFIVQWAYETLWNGFSSKDRLNSLLEQLLKHVKFK